MSEELNINLFIKMYYKDFLSPIEISKKFDIGIRKFYKILNNLNLPKRGKHRKEALSSEEKIKILSILSRDFDKELEKSNIKINFIKTDNKKNINIDEFKKLYYEENLPLKEILLKLNISIRMLYDFMEKNNLEPKHKHKKHAKHDVPKNRISNELVEDLYLNSDLSIPKIAEKLRLTEHSLSDKIKELNLPKRKDWKYKRVEGFDKNELYGKYWIENKSLEEIAKEYDTTSTLIRKALIFNEISRRDKFGKEVIERVKEKLRKRTGPLAGGWKGGLCKNPYPESFDNDLKKEIREKFKHTCFICGVHEEVCARKLSVHHINYNKECEEDWNLVALCGKCHSKTTASKRWYWFNLLVSFWTENSEINLSPIKF